MAVRVRTQEAPWEAIEKAEPKRSWRAQQNLLLGVAGSLGFLALWQFAGIVGWVNPLYTSSPVEVAGAAVRLLSSAQFWNHLQVSGLEFALGYLLAMVVGIGLGVLFGQSRVLNALANPLLSAFYATPRVALVPLIIVWFGIGINSKVVFVFLLSFFPILLNTQAGIRNVDPMLVLAARSFGVNGRQMLVHVLLPASVPFIISGLRLAVGQGVVAVVVAEFYAARAGVGYFMAIASQNLRVADSFVAVAVVAVTGLLLMGLWEYVERRVSGWKPDRS